MERSLKVAEEELAKFPSMSMPEGWWVHEGIRGILEEMEIEAIWVEEMKVSLYSSKVGQS